MRIFIIIWIGQFLSLVGSRLTQFAFNVWLFQETGSVTQFGLLVLCGSLPSLLISPIAGGFVDRWSRRWTMIIADFCAGLCTLSIAWLFITGNLEIWHLYIIEALSSCFSTFQANAYAAATTLLVPKENLPRASGLTSLGRGVSKLIAPVLAGMLLPIVHIPGIIVIDFATLFFAIVPLMVVTFQELNNLDEQTGNKSFWKEVIFGWNFLTTKPGLLALLILFASNNLFTGIFNVLTTPLVLSLTSPTGLGIVLSIGSSGVVLGSLMMSIWKAQEHYIKTIFGFTLLAGLFIFLAGLRPSLSLFTVSDFCLLATYPVISGLVQVMFQKKVPPEVQGRVFGLKDPIATVGLTLGYAIAGPLDDLIFEPLMAPDSILAGNIGKIIGVGQGRGVGLLDILLGLVVVVGTIAAYQYPRLRLLEEELPDAIPDEPFATSKF
ncbi:MFS transporter [Moorena producens JHB]|uniref:MFS transporter n=1 Tax=Moorena producens (strain JHB) TaxID=1454205 RepID=A0A1D9G1T1_MOOP1|nr:MFS transporter [Moorena producens]AOY81578.1 MFS transporter [Moorena producens JHB]